MICPAPSNVQLISLGAGAVQIGWEADTCQQVILEYGTPGFAPGLDTAAGEGTVFLIDCPTDTFWLENLTNLTDYEVYLRAGCSDSTYTANSCPLYFETLCTDSVPSIVENFDMQSVCASICGTTCVIDGGIWYNADSDDRDWLVDANGTQTGNTGPADDISGGGRYIYLETSGVACQNGANAILESTCLWLE